MLVGWFGVLADPGVHRKGEAGMLTDGCDFDDLGFGCQSIVVMIRVRKPMSQSRRFDVVLVRPPRSCAFLKGRSDHRDTK